MTLTKLAGTECPTEILKLINKIIDEKSSIDLDNLSSIGQGILDAKIEAEALAAQNGYIKFKLNGISNPFILQWIHYAGTTSSMQANFPVTFNNVFSITATANYKAGAMSAQRVLNYTESSVSVYCAPWFVIAVGN